MVDVGGGTGFCTLGVVKRVAPANVTLIDQSPHQLAKARQKPALQGVTIMEVRGGCAAAAWLWLSYARPPQGDSVWWQRPAPARREALANPSATPPPPRRPPHQLLR